MALTRDLVNEPANVLSPEKLAEIAQSMASKKKLECTIMEEDEIRDLGMNLFLSVAAGSERAPRFIHLVYKPRVEAKAVVALVGKGITFDSGGLSIKIGKAMYEMKTDMAGAGVVLGVMSALSALKPEVEVHGIIPTTDNAINGNATQAGGCVQIAFREDGGGYQHRCGGAAHFGGCVDLCRAAKAGCDHRPRHLDRGLRRCPRPPYRRGCFRRKRRPPTLT